MQDVSSSSKLMCTEGGCTKSMVSVLLGCRMGARHFQKPRRAVLAMSGVRPWLSQSPARKGLACKMRSSPIAQEAPAMGRSPSITGMRMSLDILLHCRRPQVVKFIALVLHRSHLPLSLPICCCALGTTVFTGVSAMSSFVVFGNADIRVASCRRCTWIHPLYSKFLYRHCGHNMPQLVVAYAAAVAIVSMSVFLFLWKLLWKVHRI